MGKRGQCFAWFMLKKPTLLDKWPRRSRELYDGPEKRPGKVINMMYLRWSRPRMAQKKRKVRNLTSMIQTQIHSKEILQIDDDHVCMNLIVVIILPTSSKTYIRKKKSIFQSWSHLDRYPPSPPDQYYKSDLCKASYEKQTLPIPPPRRINFSFTVDGGNKLGYGGGEGSRFGISWFWDT